MALPRWHWPGMPGPQARCPECGHASAATSCRSGRLPRTPSSAASAKPGLEPSESPSRAGVCRAVGQACWPSIRLAVPSQPAAAAWSGEQPVAGRWPWPCGGLGGPDRCGWLSHRWQGWGGLWARLPWRGRGADGHPCPSHVLRPWPPVVLWTHRPRSRRARRTGCSAAVDGWSTATRGEGRAAGPAVKAHGAGRSIRAARSTPARVASAGIPGSDDRLVEPGCWARRSNTSIRQPWCSTPPVTWSANAAFAQWSADRATNPLDQRPIRWASPQGREALGRLE